MVSWHSSPLMSSLEASLPPGESWSLEEGEKKKGSQKGKLSWESVQHLQQCKTAKCTFSSTGEKKDRDD